MIFLTVFFTCYLIKIFYQYLELYQEIIHKNIYLAFYYHLRSLYKFHLKSYKIIINLEVTIIQIS